MELGAITGFFVSLPTDWIIIGVFALLMWIDALRVGSGRIAALAVSSLVASLVAASIPDAAFLGFVSEQLSTPVLQAALFGTVLVAVFLLIRRAFIDYGEESCPPIQALFAAVAVTAIVVLVWVDTQTLEAVWRFGTQVRDVFNEAYRFWWLLGALAGLAFSRS